jgi:hypothetical protein
MDYLVKNIIVLKILLFSNFTIIIRYIFAFHSKNPTAVQDDFWTFFLNLWAIGKLNFELKIEIQLLLQLLIC